MAFLKLKATKCQHWVNTLSDKHQYNMPTPILVLYFIFHRQIVEKGSSCPNKNRGMTHQSDEKHLNNMSEYFVGVVNISFNRYNNLFL
jgi:hypothetical protein